MSSPTKERFLDAVNCSFPVTCNFLYLYRQSLANDEKQFDMLSLGTCYVTNCLRFQCDTIVLQGNTVYGFFCN